MVGSSGVFSVLYVSVVRFFWLIQEYWTFLTSTTCSASVGAYAPLCRAYHAAAAAKRAVSLINQRRVAGRAAQFAVVPGVGNRLPAISFITASAPSARPAFCRPILVFHFRSPFVKCRRTRRSTGRALTGAPVISGVRRHNCAPFLSSSNERICGSFRYWAFPHFWQVRNWHTEKYPMLPLLGEKIPLCGSLHLFHLCQQNIVAPFKINRGGTPPNRPLKRDRRYAPDPWLDRSASLLPQQPSRPCAGKNMP